MNERETARLLQQVLLGMPRGIWHALDAAAEVFPTLQQSSGLTAVELETLLLSAAIIPKRGEETRFSLRVMEHLQTAFQQRRGCASSAATPQNNILYIGRPNQNNTPNTPLQRIVV